MMKLYSLRIRYTVLFFAAVLRFTDVSSQVDSMAMAKTYYDLGMETYDFTHRKQAKEMFSLALQYNTNDAHIQFMMGKSIMLTVHKEEALPYFLRAIELDPKVDEEVFYYIGMAYHHTNQYEKAIEYYQLHRKKLIRTLDISKNKQIHLVDRKIFECYNAEIYESHPVDVTIEPLPVSVNSEYPDYAPAVSADENTLVFTSRRDDNVNADIADDHEFYEDVFISKKVNGSFQAAQNLGAPINTSFHNASITLSPDGKRLFLYSSSNGGDIYVSTLGANGEWARPIPLPGEVNSPYLENSVSVTADLQTLYFTSDRPGGYGGTDIYMAKKARNGDWITPVILGPEVNTELDEDGVFVSANGNSLYFSSNGLAGMGDLDIYRVQKDSEGQWDKPMNLGYPINTVENDIYFSLTGDEKTAYYSSVRDDSQGEQDIYRIDMSRFQPITLEDIVIKEDASDPILKVPDSTLVKLDLIVVDRENDSPLNADLQVNRSGMGGKPIIQQLDSGKYQVQFYVSKEEKYEVVVSRLNFDSYAFPLFILGKGKAEATINETVRLGASKTSSVNLVNVYFELNEATPVSEEGIHFLELMMIEQPDIHIEIAGHTDNTGDAAYNKDLSKRRAEAVKRILVRSGIDSERIKTVGYGEERPMATNENLNGRKLNRRTEFKVISNLGQKGVKSDF